MASFLLLTPSSPDSLFLGIERTASLYWAGKDHAGKSDQYCPAARGSSQTSAGMNSRKRKGRLPAMHHPFLLWSKLRHLAIFGFPIIFLHARGLPLAVFGNGRTHTGEVSGSGGSRLANYCLRVKPTWPQQLPSGPSPPVSFCSNFVMEELANRQWPRAGAARNEMPNSLPARVHKATGPSSRMLSHRSAIYSQRCNTSPWHTG